MTEIPVVRDAMEVQRAHDVLVGFILGEVPHSFSKEKLASVASVLCWVLRHDHNTTFGDLIESLETEAKRLGFDIVKPLDN